MNVRNTHAIKPKCAIIMATYNGGDFIESQLKSIIAQVDVTVTIYVTDDASTDNTLNICSDNGAQIVQSNIKFGNACNNFLFSISELDIAQDYDYVFLSDQDDVWFPEKCIKAIKALDENNCQCYSGSYYLWQPERRKILYKNKYFPQTNDDYMFRSPGPGFTFALSADAFNMIRCKFLMMRPDEIGFDWHDWLIYACARSMNLNWYIDKNPYSLYRQHANNETGQAINLQSYIKRFRYLFGGSYRAELLKFENFTPSDSLIITLKSFSITDRLYLLRLLPTMRSKFIQRLGLALWLLLGR
jgi:rhamnosyltransferase